MEGVSRLSDLTQARTLASSRDPARKAAMVSTLAGREDQTGSLKMGMPWRLGRWGPSIRRCAKLRRGGVLGDWSSFRTDGKCCRSFSTAAD